jgi:hypothetical protein
MPDKIILRSAALLSVVILLGSSGCSKPAKVNRAGKDWAVYLGDPYSSHFSTLTEKKQ